MLHYHIAQLTDCHLQKEPTATLYNICTLNSFQNTLRSAAQHQPDLYLLTGDLSHDGSSESYQHIVTATSTLSRPIAWIPGNHDHPATMQAIFEPSHLINHTVISLDPWQLILLDSYWPGHIAGRLADQQLQQLAQHLQNQKPTLIFLHHNISEPVPINMGSMFANTDQLLDIIKPYQQYIKAIICGHVHTAYDFEFRGIRLLSTPSTCYQFYIDNGQVKRTNQPPGYRMLRLSSDGQFDTNVYYIANSTSNDYR